MKTPYQAFLEDLERYMASLGEPELVRLAAILSTAETKILAQLAERFPDRGCQISS